MPQRLLCSNLNGEPCAPSRLFRPDGLFGRERHIEWPPPNWRDLRCWNCALPLESPPVPLAFARSAGFFKVHGIFCGFPCAKAWQLDRSGFCTGSEVLLLTGEMAREVYGLRSTDIGLAPPGRLLQMFGGPLTPEEFRSAPPLAIVTPPFITIPEMYETPRDGAATWSVDSKHPCVTPVTLQNLVTDAEAAAASQGPQKRRTTKASSLREVASGADDVHAEPPTQDEARAASESERPRSRATRAESERADGAGTPAPTTNTLARFLKRR